jgi:hypothetical protein
MEIRNYNRQQLNDFIHSEEFNRLRNIPISRHRALSQINNPRAEDDDILLAVMFETDQVIGYLGVLPDQVYNKDQKEKAGWLSCFWVDEPYRSQQVAAGLFLQIMEKWDQRILITNFVPSLTPLYQKTGFFQPVMIQTGLRAYMRSDLAEILPPKRIWLKRIRPFLRIWDVCFNLIGDVRFLLFGKRRVHSFGWQWVDDIDAAAAAYIRDHNRDSWSNRGKEELQWIHENPWVLEGPQDRDSKRYYFTSVSRRFLCRMIKITDNAGAMCGFLLICIRNGHMTIPYLFADGHYKEIAAVLIREMVDRRLNMITTFHKELAQAFGTIRFPFLLKKKILKPYLISKRLGFIQSLHFQDGDGDCAFY